MDYQIRVVQSEDVALLRPLRLAALRGDPDAFLMTPEAEIAQTDESVAARIKPTHDSFIIGAFASEGAMIGMVGAHRDSKEKLRHSMDVWGTYVTPAARGLGVCAAMMRALVTQARACGGVQCLKLGVIDGNMPALKSYESLGFKTFATEPMFMRVANGTIAAQHMMIYEMGSS